MCHPFSKKLSRGVYMKTILIVAVILIILLISKKQLIKVGILAILGFAGWIAISNDLISLDFIKKEKATQTDEVSLIRVVDGDTIVVMLENKETTIRYLLIDAPEKYHANQPEQPFSKEATEMNKQLLESGKITLEFDEGNRYDKYQRLLAYVYVDGQRVQDKLLEKGLARVAYIYPPNDRYENDLKKIEEQAIEAKQGVWSIDGYVSDKGFGVTN